LGKIAEAEARVGMDVQKATQADDIKWTQRFGRTSRMVFGRGKLRAVTWLVGSQLWGTRSAAPTLLRALHPDALEVTATIATHSLAELAPNAFDNLMLS
jgi:hypothetical protein